MNCAHPYWRAITPESLATVAGLSLLQLGGLRREKDAAEVGALPESWNRLVDEGHPVEGAKVLHWTAGMPGFAKYRDAPGADLWRAQLAHMHEVD